MDKNQIRLNEDERDCLQELMNISFASATAAVSKIIDKFATLGIPKIETISATKLKEHLIESLVTNNSFYMASQLINGQISGENLFIIDSKSSKNLAKEFDLDEDEIDENEIKDIVLEITNILSSTTSAKLADLIKASISFSSPKVSFFDSLSEFNKQFQCNYENIIIISTQLKFEDQQINGELVVMTNKESSIYLKKALNIVLEEY
ncbi:MAG: chemotaxis protein CheC [Halarcobacter sp.]